MLNRLKDVVRSLQEHEVRYLVIGGIAAVIHGVPRATFDLDILIEPTPENGKRLLEALAEAGMGTDGLPTWSRSWRTRSPCSRIGYGLMYRRGRRV